MNPVVLVPAFQGVIHWRTERALRGCEAMGVPVQRVVTSAGIDRHRSIMASTALREGYDTLFWVDADIGFEPSDAVSLIADEHPFISGVYVQKAVGGRATIAPHPDEAPRFVCGAGGGLMRIESCGFGFVKTSAEVFERIAEDLPVCRDEAHGEFAPYFLPMVDGDRYHGEDAAFCLRARTAAFELYADTRPRLRHFGDYGYTLEDGQPRPTYASVEVTVSKPGR